MGNGVYGDWLADLPILPSAMGHRPYHICNFITQINLRLPI